MKWLLLTEEQRRSTLNQLAISTGLKEKALEKDWWVTLVLKAIFNTEYKEHLLFKGGTSLSKCFGLINRFSEDIDLALNREFLNFGGKLSKQKIKDLKKAAALFTVNDFMPALEKGLMELGVPEVMLQITAIPTPEKQSPNDPQIILIAYPSLYDQVEYIAEAVQVEVSARSLIDPFTHCSINSILSQELPDAPYAEASFIVPAVEPRRTFLEKAFLLHEEFQLKEEKMTPARKSRHLYDLERMMDQDHAVQALSDDKLYNDIIEHRKHFHALKDVDYLTHHRSTIDFIPPHFIMDAYRKDYRTMREQMIYGDPPEFDQLIERLVNLKDRFRQV